MILFRAIFFELLAPFFMTLMVTAGLLVTEKVYRMVKLLVDQQLNLEEVGMMLLLLLPQVFSLTFPLAVVGAVFITVIRQSMDSEVVALRATGRSLLSYAMPFFVFGLMVSLATTVITLWLQPLAGQKYRQLQAEMVRWRAETKLVPGVFNTEFGGKAIRIGARGEGKELRDIFIADSEPGANTSVIIARSGRIDVDQDSGQVVFRLRDGEIYTMEKKNSLFRDLHFDTLRYALNYKPSRTFNVKSIRTVGTLDLIAGIRDPKMKKRKRDGFNRELQRRAASPWAALAFALAALPMALVDPRSGKRAGYMRAIFLVAAYFIAWTAFKNLMNSGRIPPEAMWTPSALICGYGMLRLWQINVDADSLWRVFWRP